MALVHACFVSLLLIVSATAFPQEGFGFFPGGGAGEEAGATFPFPMPFVPGGEGPHEELPPFVPREEPKLPPTEEIPPPKEEIPPPKEEVPPKEETPTEEFPGVLPGGMIPNTGNGYGSLRPGYYREKCPNAEAIVKSVLQQAVEKNPRTAASLLRLHFHDCFVQGCDASLLLDDTRSFQGEKTANPNLNSARGFEVVDEIKAALERECEGVVSCADILAIAARDSVALTGGPSWEVLLGRRDSLTASKRLANRDIPPPNSTLSQLIASFARKGLSAADMVILSGSHTIGVTRCASFRQRLYNFANTRRPDPNIHPELFVKLQGICPKRGNAQITTVLDSATPTRFDNHYYRGLTVQQGVLTSDQVLFAPNSGPSGAMVMAFAENEDKFFKEFAASMIKMGNINPLVGSQGQIRKQCRFVNN